MSINRENAVILMTDLTCKIRALVQTNREYLAALGKASPEAMEELARVDAEAERTLDMVRRVAAGNVSPNELRQLTQQLICMGEVEKLRGLARPEVLN